MIKYTQGKHGAAPMIFCDACGEPIDDQNGIVLFPRAEAGTIVDVFYSHKGSCDEALSARYGKLPGSQSVYDFLRYLMKGVGLRRKLNEDALDRIGDVSIGFPRSIPLRVAQPDE